ncbi:MAG: hypothetical protein H6620_06195 [Halobacteriovoraceae bacterium]|nr:hypothetical protein [Halobacteriovoraceae bacterium]
MKVVLCFLILLSTQYSFAGLKEQKLLRLVNTEIASIVKVKSKKDQLSYRLFELYSERLKLIRKVENEELLKGKTTKANAFTKSTKYFKQAQDYGHYLLSKYPKSRFVPEVYFTLAGNIIDIRNNLEVDEPRIVEYLQKAIQSTNKASIRYKAQVKLAELYYSVKKYKEAIAYYKIVIKNTKDSWYTKNLFNYSWCLFQEQDYQQAIDLAIKAHKYSRSKRYTDMRDQIADSLNYFYTYNKEPNKAIEFHIKYTKKDIEEKFMGLLNLSLTYIGSDVALKAEIKAREYCELKKKYACLYTLSQFKLDIFKDGKNYDQHFNTTIALTNEFKKLKDKEREKLQEVTNKAINNIAGLSSYFQSLAYKDHYIINGGKEETYRRVVVNYDNLKVLNPSFQYEYAFLQAELSYKEQKFKEASQFYLESHSKTPKEKIVEFYPKLFKSMISLANEKGYEDKKYFETAYTLFIKYKPKDPETVKIYENLFKFYITEKSMDKGISLVEEYNKNIPANIDKQREMFKVVLNHYIQIKNTQVLADWIFKMRDGYLSFDKKFLYQNIVILGQLLFEKIKKLEDQKNYKMAIKEYIKIYKNKLYPPKIKNDSSFNISIDYLKLNSTKNSYRWLVKSINAHELDELKPKIDIVLASAQRFYLLQSLKYSQSIYNEVTNKYCQYSKTYPDHYAQIQEINLALKDIQSYSNTITHAPQCQVKPNVVETSRERYVDYLLENSEYDTIQKEIKGAPLYGKYQDKIYNHFKILFWQEPTEHGKVVESEAYVMLNEFVKDNPVLSNKLRSDFNLIVSFVNYYQKIVTEPIVISYPEVFKFEDFNKDFNEVLAKLTKTKDEGLTLANNSNDPNLYSATLAIVHFKMKEFKESLQNYPLAKVDKEIQAELKKNLDQIVAGINQQMTQLLTLYRDADKNEEVINHYVRYFNFNTDISKVSLYKNKKIEAFNVNKEGRNIGTEK